MTALTPIVDLIEEFITASPEDGDAHWRSELVRKIADHPDKDSARAALETLLRETGFEGSQAVRTNPFPHPSLKWRNVAWKELLTGFWTDEEAFTFASDMAKRHASRYHRMEATGFISGHLENHPERAAPIYHYIVDPQNADVARDAISSLNFKYLMQIARAEDPGYACHAASYLIRHHLSDPGAQSVVENLLFRYPLGFASFAYEELARNCPPCSRVLRIWLVILRAAETAHKAWRLPLAIVAHRFRASKQLREKLFRVAQLSPLSQIRISSIEALALHFASDRRTLPLLIDRLERDPSSSVRSRAFIWLIAQYSRRETAVCALVSQLSAESDQEALGEMLGACVGQGFLGQPVAWRMHWPETHRSCDLALDEFPLCLFPRADFQTLLVEETARGTGSFILNLLRPELTRLRGHLDSYPLENIEYDQDTRAQWARVLSQVDNLTRTSCSVALLLRRFREADDLTDADCDRERKYLVQQIGENPDNLAARSALENLLLEKPDEEDSFRDRSNIWRDLAWKSLFQNLWSDEEGATFVRRFVTENSSAQRNGESLRHLVDGCKSRVLTIEVLKEHFDDKDVGASAKAMMRHNFPDDPASYPLLLEKMAKDDYVKEHPIETLCRCFPDRSETRQAVESEIRGSPLRKSEAFFRAYAQAFPNDACMKSTLVSAIEAALDHAAEGYRSAKAPALGVYMEHFGSEPEARDLVLRAAQACVPRGSPLTAAGLTWLALAFHDDPRALDILCDRLVHDRNGSVRVCAFAGLLGRFWQRIDVTRLLLDHVFKDGNAEVRENLRNVMAGRGYEPSMRFYEFSRIRFIEHVNDEPTLLDRVRRNLQEAQSQEFRTWAQELFGL